ERDAVGAARAEVAAARALADEASEARAEVLAQVQARKAAYEAELLAAAAVSSSIATLLQQFQAGQEVLPATAGLFSLPVPEAVLTSPFGNRTHPIYGDVRLHAGMDFGAPSGTVIFAAGDGVVVAAGRRGGYGNAVIIDHGNGLATLYGHQRLFIVKEGQRVRKGDAIGEVGSTGNSTGPHLHFEVRRLGAPVDPLAYL
ncbi:MAG: M23 family metallopeptidase, partial [Actinomycetota bacterium]|nr:M23 family metallopeptidase [Actinomycetota bacterium]